MKSKGGRPSTFKPEYCVEIIEHMSAGNSLQSFAGKVCVSRDTIYAWINTRPDFHSAKQIAEAACLEYWEQIGIDAVTGKTRINGSMWVWQMRNRFRWAWPGKHKT